MISRCQQEGSVGKARAWKPELNPNTHTEEQEKQPTLVAHQLLTCTTGLHARLHTPHTHTSMDGQQLCACVYLLSKKFWANSMRRDAFLSTQWDLEFGPGVSIFFKQIFLSKIFLSDFNDTSCQKLSFMQMKSTSLLSSQQLAQVRPWGHPYWHPVWNGNFSKPLLCKATCYL